MKKTIVFSILSALLLFIPVGARASTIDSITKITTYPVVRNQASPVTVHLHWQDGDKLTAGEVIQAVTTNFDEWFTNAPSATLPSGCSYTAQTGIATSIMCDADQTDITFTRDIVASTDFVYRVRYTATPTSYKEVAYIVVDPTPTPTSAPAGTAGVMNDFGNNMKIAAINYLAGVSLPIAFVGLVSIVLLFAVIRWFRAILHI